MMGTLLSPHAADRPLPCHICFDVVRRQDGRELGIQRLPTHSSKVYFRIALPNRSWGQGQWPQQQCLAQLMQTSKR